MGRVPAGEIEAAVIDQLRAVFRQPEIVAGTWKAVHAQHGDISEVGARAALQQLDPLWEELFPAEQARIVTLLVERVDIGADSLNVKLRVDGLSGLASEMLAGRMGLRRPERAPTSTNMATTAEPITSIDRILRNRLRRSSKPAKPASTAPRMSSSSRRKGAMEAGSSGVLPGLCGQTVAVAAVN